MGDGYAKLAGAVIINAVEDWRQLIRSKAYRDHGSENMKDGGMVNFGELRLFFKSDFCDLLFDVCQKQVAGRYVLRHLEAELEQAMENDEELQRARRRIYDKDENYLCLEDGFTCRYMSEAAKHSYVTYQRIHQVLDRENKTANGMHWRRIKDCEKR